MSHPDKKYMRLAIELAKKGVGHVSPNPMVGCVIVKKNKIIASGYHKKFGSHHAEINALKKVKHKAKNATMYVTLEPCHHHGKTPPCVEAVIASGVKRVVIAMKDPNPLTGGKSVKKLRKAGVLVDVGICEDEAKDLNRYFVKNITKKLPYVIVKVAQSLDGKISTKKGKQGWITGDESRKYVQKLRSQIDAVLVGRQTVLIDNPQLNVRDKRQPQPKRIILDSKLRTPMTQKIFSVHGGNLIFVSSLPKTHARVKAFQKQGVQVLCVAQKNSQTLNLRVVLSRLQAMGIGSILVEGGTKVFTSFLKSRLVDEWQFIVAPKIIGDQGVPAFDAIKDVRLQISDPKKLGTDFLIQAFLK